MSASSSESASTIQRRVRISLLVTSYLAIVFYLQYSRVASIHSQASTTPTRPPTTAAITLSTCHRRPPGAQRNALRVFAPSPIVHEPKLVGHLQPQAESQQRGAR